VPDIGFVHRRANEAEIYFLANTNNVTQRTQANFRVEGMEPEWWNLMIGSAEPAQILGRGQDTVAPALDMEPYGSRVLRFTRRPRPPPSQQPNPEPCHQWSISFRMAGYVLQQRQAGSHGTIAVLDRGRGHAVLLSGWQPTRRPLLFRRVCCRRDSNQLEFGEGKPMRSLPRDLEFTGCRRN
jgi:hypothetical protein